MIEKKGYSNRSEAIRDIIREYVHKDSKEEVRIVKILIDPRIKSYQNRILDIQNDYHCLISSLTREYIDDKNSVEIMVLKGNPTSMNKFLEKIKKCKGVKEVNYL